MREPTDEGASERPVPSSTTWNELVKDVARRNEEAHREALKLRVASGRAARDQKRARDLR
jgi:hypothetical protein